jgi:hypothetical protein
VAAGAVSFRFRDGSQINGVPVQAAVDAIAGWISRRVNDSPTAENFAAGLPAKVESAAAGNGAAGPVVPGPGTAS